MKWGYEGPTRTDRATLAVLRPLARIVFPVLERIPERVQRIAANIATFWPWSGQ